MCVCVHALLCLFVHACVMYVLVCMLLCSLEHRGFVKYRKCSHKTCMYSCEVTLLFLHIVCIGVCFCLFVFVFVSVSVC